MSTPWKEGAITLLVSHISEFTVHGYRSGSGLTTPYFTLQGSLLLVLLLRLPSRGGVGLLSGNTQGIIAIISARVTEMENQRICIKFCVKNGFKGADIF
ncbi:hypothetical protein LAZ67_14003332 [Cordylochernes scorpioides]|uniref:Uncharacterized protein n=1 Tax=Cordylochernes scorpioides TaxID=51811 RepID=A0ABY6L7V5_9ARAC|nr:hypothetical protein LAZ67_14003332 [Cordylochernes scorpioides]